VPRTSTVAAQIRSKFGQLFTIPQPLTDDFVATVAAWAAQDEELPEDPAEAAALAAALARKASEAVKKETSAERAARAERRLPETVAVTARKELKGAVLPSWKVRAHLSPPPRPSFLPLPLHPCQSPRWSTSLAEHSRWLHRCHLEG
jgi:hypothetical protein